MEEILASIRRIISEDDAPAAEAAPPPASEPEPAPEPPAAFEPAPEPEPEPEPAHDDVLELTDKIGEPDASVGDLDVYARPEPAPPPPRPEPVAAAPPPPPLAPEEGLVSEPAAFQAASAFGSLSAHIAMPAPGRTLEDVTRELLRPLLKAWLDENLPRIVEAEVAKEVERISRTRVR